MCKKIGLENAFCAFCEAHSMSGTVCANEAMTYEAMIQTQVDRFITQFAEVDVWSLFQRSLHDTMIRRRYPKTLTKASSAKASSAKAPPPTTDSQRTSQQEKVSTTVNLGPLSAARLSRSFSCASCRSSASVCSILVR